MLVGEIVFNDQARVAPYLRPDELQLAFNFSLVFQDWNADAIRESIDSSLAALPIVTWVLENHDVTRIVTRFGEREARAAALLLLALPGPVFLYQGQELGLEEVDLPDEVRQDPIFKRTGGERKGRDGCRVPLPWTRELPARSWLPHAGGRGPAKSVEAQLEDDASFLALYRRALELRPSGRFSVARVAAGRARLRARRARVRRERERRALRAAGGRGAADERAAGRHAFPPERPRWLRAPGVED